MSRRMPEPAGLISGIAFVGIGLVFLVGEVDLAGRARWVWPIVLFSLGAGILAAVLGRPTDEAVPVAGPVDEPSPPAPEPEDRAGATEILPAEEPAEADHLTREQGGQDRAGAPPA